MSFTAALKMAQLAPTGRNDFYQEKLSDILMKTFLLIIFAFRDLILAYLPFRASRSGGFAFLVHPRDLKDVYRKYPFSRFFSEKTVLWILRRFWPGVLAKVEGVSRLKDGKPARGFIIFVPLTPAQMLKDKEFAKRKIYRAARLAENLGARIIGLGAYTSSLTKNGDELAEKIDCAVTSGSAYTAVASVSGLKKIFLDAGREINDAEICILGATGAVGRLAAEMLLRDGAQKISLAARTAENLRFLEEYLAGKYPRARITSASDLKILKTADCVVVATNSPSAIISPEHLKNGAIVYDISQPKNVSSETMRKSAGRSFYDGGLVGSPEKIRYHFNFGLPAGAIFSCLAETIIIAAAELPKDAIKCESEDYQNKLRKLGAQLGFLPYVVKL